MSLATTPSTIRNSVSVPMLLSAPNAVDQRRISAANEPSSPIHTTPIVVTAMFGSGPDSTPGRADEAGGPGDERERHDEGQALDTDPVGGQRCGDAGRQPRGDRRSVALLGDLAEVLEPGDGQHDRDERDDADRPPERGDDEHAGEHEAGADGGRQVAWRRGRASPRSGPVRRDGPSASATAAPRRLRPAGGRRSTPDGSVPIVMRPGSRRGGAAIGISPDGGRDIGCDRRVGTHLAREVAIERPARLAGTCPLGSRGKPPLGSFVGSSSMSSRQIGDSVVNDDHTSTSSSRRRTRPPAPCAAPRPSAGRSSAAAVPCRWGRSSAGAPPCRRTPRRSRDRRPGTADRRTPRTGRAVALPSSPLVVAHQFSLVIRQPAT